VYGTCQYVQIDPKYCLPIEGDVGADQDEENLKNIGVFSLKFLPTSINDFMDRGIHKLLS
jgi:hypothetical protein